MNGSNSKETLSFGQTLRSAREQCGVSLEEIARVTRVRIRYLRALEQETFDALPADVYVRGYVRAYAREVGLDPEQALDRYHEVRGTRPDAPVLRLAPVDRPETPPVPARRILSVPEGREREFIEAAPLSSRRATTDAPRPPRRLSLALAILLVLVAAVTIAVIHYVNQPRERGGDPGGPTTTETATFDVAG